MEALLERGTDVENWNDDRLDELSRRMDAGFEKAATKVELTAVKDEMSLRFAEVDKRFDRVDAQFFEINERLDRLNHTLLVGAIGVIAALIANGIFG